MRTYKVYAIKDGTVIDHIPKGKSLKVIDILGLKDGGILTIGMNFDSAKLGQKDVLKIENKFLTPAEVNKISLVAPTATVNIIKEHQNVEKRKMEIPDVIDNNIIRCNNPKCITNSEPVSTKFYVTSKDPLVAKCHYCEREVHGEEIEIK